MTTINKNLKVNAWGVACNLKPKVKLPRKLSDLTELAMSDLAKVEKDRRYRVSMGVWHYPTTRSAQAVCEVCFAGAVIAKSLDGAYRDKEILPDSFPPSVNRKLVALDQVRLGGVVDAAVALGFSNARIKKIEAVERRVASAHLSLLDRFLTFPSYEGNRRQWKSAMRTIIRELRKIGE